MVSIMKKMFVMMSVLLSMGLLSSCSSDDDTKDVVVKDLNTVEDYDSISVDFGLLNAEGQAVKTFKEGEQILFRLIVTNKTDRTLKIRWPIYIVGDDLFQVYSKGLPLNKPWDYSLIAFGPVGRYWAAHKSYVYECPWHGQVFEPENAGVSLTDWPSSNVALFKTQERQPLSVGNYYTQFKLNLNEQTTITCHKDFSVIAK
jgi:hypothetical protein